jgi:hypothetical protein
MTDLSHPSPSFAEVLHSNGPAPDRGEQLGLYSFLVGRWQTDIVTHEPGGATHRGRGEIHAGWVLEGRAIQDVWMIPPRTERRADAPVLPVAGNWYGTTLRVPDPRQDVWHIFWIDPATQFFTRQIGRAQGPDIVQQGTAEDGTAMRWRFTERTPTSFHWLGEARPGGSADWWLQVEVFARRAP